MVKLFVEGTNIDTNGNLRQAFGQLLEKSLKGKMPRIVMGNGKSETIDKFKTDNTCEKKFLLIDLDKDEQYKNEDIRNYDLENHKEDSFFMIQEVESWFFSQPEIIDKCYKKPFSGEFPKKPACQISNPSDELNRIFKKVIERDYHKVIDCVKILPQLDLNRLKDEFEDVDKLLDKFD